MPRFRSVLHKAAKDTYGGVGASGTSIFVPMDDAAAIHPLAEMAEQTINPSTSKPYFTRKEPKEVTRKRLKNAELVALGRKPIH